jgi:hypothetical protein
MILGMSVDTFTQVHVILSLVGIVSGLIVVFGMLSTKKLDGLAALFLTTTVLTSVTGFFFPVSGFMPSHAIGILSLVFLRLQSLLSTSTTWRDPGDGSMWWAQCSRSI